MRQPNGESKVIKLDFQIWVENVQGSERALSTLRVDYRVVYLGAGTIFTTVTAIRARNAVGLLGSGAAWAGAVCIVGAHRLLARLFVTD
jgi:hypothetical protein